MIFWISKRSRFISATSAASWDRWSSTTWHWDKQIGIERALLTSVPRILLAQLSKKHVLSAQHFALDHLFSSFWKTAYASQIKCSRLAQVGDILARDGDILVNPGFTCQTSKSPITQGAPPTQWLVGLGNPKRLSLFLLVYLSATRQLKSNKKY